MLGADPEDESCEGKLKIDYFVSQFSFFQPDTGSWETRWNCVAATKKNLSEGWVTSRNSFLTIWLLATHITSLHFPTDEVAKEMQVPRAEEASLSPSFCSAFHRGQPMIHSNPPGKPPLLKPKAFPNVYKWTSHSLSNMDISQVHGGAMLP